MNNFSTQPNHGFIALLSILIISTVLFVATLSIAQFGIASRYFIMDLEQKTASYKLAEACLEVVRIKIYNDASYSQNALQNININQEVCTIESVTKNGLQTIVKVTGKNSLAVTHLQIIFNNQTSDYISWMEVVHF